MRYRAYGYPGIVWRMASPTETRENHFLSYANFELLCPLGAHNFNTPYHKSFLINVFLGS